VVIVAYNSDDVLDSCLDALAAASAQLLHARGVGCSLTVVDNASARPVEVPAMPFSVEVHRLETNLGFAPGANIGAARAAGAQWLLFLNPDSRLEPGALVHLAAALEDSGAVLASPILVDPAGNALLSERPFHSLRRELRTQLLPLPRRPFGRHAAATGKARCLTGACLLVDRVFFESVGGFDEQIRMYLEDVELCWRARTAGRDVNLVTAARCIHGRGRSSGGVNFETELGLHLTLLSARVEFVRRRSGSAAALALRLAIATGALVRLVVNARRQSARRHVTVFRWALASGRPPSWRSARLAPGSAA
jgi:GT2 family glycosyltransferase